MDLNQFKIKKKKKLKIKRKEVKNPKNGSKFSLQGKLSNIDERVELNEHTLSLLFCLLNYYS